MKINIFNNILFPACISFFGVYFAIRLQTCNLKSDERSKEFKYMNSLKTDLIKDTVKLNKIIGFATKTMTGLDSALNQMQKSMTDVTEIKLNYLLIMKCDWFPEKLNFTEGTISQLKYTGNLRLVEDPEISDSIGLYDVGKNLCQAEEQLVMNAYNEALSTEKYVYNYKERLDFQNKIGATNSSMLDKLSNDYLLKQMSNDIRMATSDKSKIIACYNDFAAYQASLELYVNALNEQKGLTKNLIVLLKNKYELK